MNKKEQAQLDSLIDRVCRTTDLIYRFPGCTSVCDCKMVGMTPIEKMAALIAHLDACDIYLRYSRFDQEASVRDLSKLLCIIETLGGKKQ